MGSLTGDRATIKVEQLHSNGAMNNTRGLQVSDDYNAALCTAILHRLFLVTTGLV